MFILLYLIPVHPWHHRYGSLRMHTAWLYPSILFQIVTGQIYEYRFRWHFVILWCHRVSIREDTWVLPRLPSRLENSAVGLLCCTAAVFGTGIWMETTSVVFHVFPLKSSFLSIHLLLTSRWWDKTYAFITLRSFCFAVCFKPRHGLSPKPLISLSFPVKVFPLFANQLL